MENGMWARKRQGPAGCRTRLGWRHAAGRRFLKRAGGKGRSEESRVTAKHIQGTSSSGGRGRERRQWEQGDRGRVCQCRRRQPPRCMHKLHGRGGQATSSFSTLRD